MKNLYPETTLNAYGIKSLIGNRFLSSFGICLIFTVFSLINNKSAAQTGINSFTYLNNPATTFKSYTGPGGGIGAQSEYIPSSNNTWTYNFGLSSGLSAGSLSVNGYITGGSSFSILQNIITSVVMRRVNNAVVTGNRDILFFTGNRNPGVSTSGQTNTAMTMNLNTDYVAAMGSAFSDNNLMIGTDNIFSNQGNGNGNNNNIERVDVMINAGFLVTDAHKFGFPILERGVYGAHDAFKIAVITGKDASGNPSAYSQVLSVTASGYNNTDSKNPVADGTYTYFLFKRDGTSDLQVNQHITNQGIGGVGFRFSDFGISNGTTIYGYSIMANDFNSTLGTDVVDYTNTTRFPTNTNETVGGLDPLAVMGIAMETMILPVKMTSFSAVESNNDSELKWTTVTEVDNKGFYVQRSADGIKWSDISFVPSIAENGNSTSQLKYSFSDRKPLNGSNYYRLRQVDNNSKDYFSEIRIVAFENNSTMRIFPNPVVNTINIQGIKANYSLILTDNKGSVISNIRATASSISMTSDKLLPGIYFLRVTDDNALLIKTMKVVKI
jgi:hypothetical protein